MCMCYTLTMVEAKDVRFQLLCSKTERAMLEELAESRGSHSAGDVIRALIREAHAATFGPPKPIKSKIATTKGKK